MIDGFRITILTAIFPDLGACISRIVLVFSTFSCCWSRLSRKRRPKTQNRRPLENEELENEELENEDPPENEDLENEDP